ncbi:30S ribosomal protein S12 methylthiotransferase RimO [Vampirovibrio sp.]|uniref:30S ribosomal protein S12 methylthiotransferase RimO n=1 Tax=Vampirovibrio sp. TaxID=2717857 RepID=UPI003593CC38
MTPPTTTLTDSSTDALAGAMVATPESLPVTAKKKVGFVHLGCPKNLVDTETMLGILDKEHHQIVASEEEADIVLVNTCAFIDSAQKESVGVLASLAEQGKELLITGCLAQKFQGELLDLFPEAKAVVGINNVAEIGDVMKRVENGERVLAMQQDPTYILEEDTVRRHITVGSYTYLKIAEGCDYKCSFCIIPSMRGVFRSRGVQNIVDNAREMAQRGVTEIILVGQDTTSYGKDIGSSLPALLRALNEVEEIEWIRFMYAYPNLVSDELLEAINDCDKVVKYLDCPLQHSHPEVLKRMRRPVTDLVAFAERARAKIKNVKLRTSFIVGFPGETEEHYQHLKTVIEQVQWDRLGVFEYSDVDTAHSKTLDGKVKKSVIKQRRNELMALQQQIAFAQNQTMIGQTVEVLIDMINQYGTLIGRTQWDAPEVDNTVQVKGQAVPGEIVKVKITHVTPYDLKGIVVSD